MMDEFEHDGLRGMETICRFTGYSRRVVDRLRREMGLPVAMIGGKWESSRSLIEQWRIRVLTEGRGEES